METKIIEADQDNVSYGTYLLGKFDREEWARPSIMQGMPSLLHYQGWTGDHILILDLSRPGVGAIFRCGGVPRYDLEKRRLLVDKVAICPLFEPFLEWLYTQDTKDLKALPDTVELEGMFDRAERLRLRQEEWDKAQDALAQVALMVEEDPPWRGAKRRPDFE